MTIRVVQGHAPDVLSQMEAESAHLVCTSPPYFQLRSYGTEPQIWPNQDGTPLCADGAHEWDETGKSATRLRNGIGSTTTNLGDGKGSPHLLNPRMGTLCARCGCWRGELGQEPTVDRYVADLVSVFDAVRRVLRRDGLCWVNLAGSYFNNPGGQNGTSGNVSARAIAARAQVGRQDRIGAAGKDSWLKPLDWVDTPGLFAHAMQRAGWYWRADIALVKKAPLPESVSGWSWQKCRVKVVDGGRGRNSESRAEIKSGRLAEMPIAEWADCPGCSRCAPNDGLILRRGNGRPTRAWERFLVFAKAPGAFWDSEAVREPAEYGRRAHTTGWKPWGKQQEGIRSHGTVGSADPTAGRNLRDWQFWPTTGGVGGLQHFAAYPLGLPDLAIRASTSEKCCSKCLAPYARVVERRFLPQPDVRDAAKLAKASGKGLAAENGWGETPRGTTESETTGWRSTCGHDVPPVPATVLDPFVGAGTTLIAADRLGRSAIGIDVQPTYIDLAARRARRDAPLFADVEVEGKAAGRPQLARAWELFRAAGLGQAHLDAMRAAGITDTGKAQITQTGYGKNTAEARRLASEAKGALRGYYRELLGRSIDDAPPLPAPVSTQRDLFSVLDEEMDAETEAAGG